MNSANGMGARKPQDLRKGERIVRHWRSIRIQSACTIRQSVGNLANTSVSHNLVRSARPTELQSESIVCRKVDESSKKPQGFKLAESSLVLVRSLPQHSMSLLFSFP